MSTKIPINTSRIVIIDDHPSTRDGLSMRIGIEPDLQVVGEAADVEEGFDANVGDVRHGEFPPDCRNPCR